MGPSALPPGLSHPAPYPRPRHRRPGRPRVPVRHLRRDRVSDRVREGVQHRGTVVPLAAPGRAPQGRDRLELDCHVRRRVTTMDGVINQSADSYFTIATGDRNPDLVTSRGAGGHIARINAVSPVTEIQEEITARMPIRPEAARLSIPDGT